MKKIAPYTLNIDMSLSEDMDTCTCKCITTVKSETVLAALLASAAVAIAHDHSCAPHKFAEALCAERLSNLLINRDLQNPKNNYLRGYCEWLGKIEENGL